MDSFRENRKKSKRDRFFNHFWAKFGSFLTSEPYDSDAIEHMGL